MEPDSFRSRGGSSRSSNSSKRTHKKGHRTHEATADDTAAAFLNVLQSLNVIKGVAPAPPTAATSEHKFSRTVKPYVAPHLDPAYIVHPMSAHGGTGMAANPRGASRPVQPPIERHEEELRAWFDSVSAHFRDKRIECCSVSDLERLWRLPVGFGKKAVQKDGRFTLSEEFGSRWLTSKQLADKRGKSEAPIHFKTVDINSAPDVLAARYNLPHSASERLRAALAGPPDMDILESLAKTAKQPKTVSNNTNTVPIVSEVAPVVNKDVPSEVSERPHPWADRVYELLVRNGWQTAYLRKIAHIIPPTENLEHLVTRYLHKDKRFLVFTKHSSVVVGLGSAGEGKAIDID